MPDPNERRFRTGARLRKEEKYLLVDSSKHPYKLYYPIKDRTEAFKELMRDKNYFRIITQIDSNRYIMTQWYIFCEEDIWVCGDAVMLNANPEKKILCQALCVVTRKQCPCYDEDSHEFILMCPNCRKLAIAVKRTHWICPHCKFAIRYNWIESVPYLVSPCRYCPIEMGWDNVQELNQKDPTFYLKMLRVRKAVLEKKMGDDIEKLKKELLENAEPTAE